ncbi:Bug family tripartite tricarboxylate transporter substrate binding protein [Advenella mimigardefordensis]|uniref:Putative Bug-like extracytoplasmic solute binding receptor, TTT family n=1 Tax=Advenella mimigardefordensis (strain DSM 17166 / LMG 22922 / DPN7) TaxID=1247726 RepID=W0PB39_ADVMD|nr:tripartite tricarboxylate transporter substrate binding protein [Advenella mimigardefordensis]AHG64089.1 putative Bug-like extracytoplasmic solute binding receptor, TTT family [Advenella mimigardefordensis DPN7]
MRRRAFLALIAFPLYAQPLFAGDTADSNSYPDKPVRVIVPTSAGGMTDQVARLYAEYLSVQLKQSFVVENMPGASTMLASRYVARAPANGYTLLVTANSIVTIPVVTKDTGYQLKDFTGIGEVGRAPSLLVVSGDSPYKTLPELIKAARDKPGNLTYAFTGYGTTSHITAQLFAQQAKITLTGVPYKGISLAVPDVTSKRVDFMMGPITSTEALIKSGKMRALAITADTRSAALPDVPTFKESGYADATYNLVFGMVAPAGLNTEITQRLSTALESAKNDPEFGQRLQNIGLHPSDIRTSAQYNAFLADEQKLSLALAREAGLDTH